MLNINSLTFIYQSKDRQAEPMLFDLQARAGEILSLIGPSGSGKSTFLGLIAGFNAPISGQIGSSAVTASPAMPAAVIFLAFSMKVIR